MKKTNKIKEKRKYLVDAKHPWHPKLEKTYNYFPNGNIKTIIDHNDESIIKFFYKNDILSKKVITNLFDDDRKMVIVFNTKGNIIKYTTEYKEYNTKNINYFNYNENNKLNYKISKSVLNKGTKHEKLITTKKEIYKYENDKLISIIRLKFDYNNKIIDKRIINYINTTLFDNFYLSNGININGDNIIRILDGSDNINFYHKIGHIKRINEFDDKNRIIFECESGDKGTRNNIYNYIDDKLSHKRIINNYHFDSSTLTKIIDIYYNYNTLGDCFKEKYKYTNIDNDGNITINEKETNYKWEYELYDDELNK